MRVVVTGAAGFLGRQVAAHLRDEGFEVTGFDRDDAPAMLAGVDWIGGDLLDADAVVAAARGKDAIVHLGAIGDVYLAAEQPELAAAVNVTGSAHVARAAREAGAKVVYASTWEVYGEPEREPIAEDHPTNPDHPYNITKLAGERMLLAADHLWDVPTIALRLGTAYGPGLRPNSVFRIFIDKARAAEPITIDGDGSQGRQFTHSSDIARAFAMACRSDLRAIAFNIVAPDTVSIKELAELVAERFPTDLSFGQPRPGDVPPALVSAKRADEKLGWRAEMPFDRGLAALIDDVIENG